MIRRESQTIPSAKVGRLVGRGRVGRGRVGRGRVCRGGCESNDLS